HITALRPGWAEQDPASWWENLKLATRYVMEQSHASADEVAAIGISYQMHGLVCVDKDRNVLRPSIIWCDSRAVPYGNAAFEAIGGERCLEHLLNSPGNFTAAKLAWVKENEPEIFAQIDKIMLPGDYIAMRMSGGECKTTVSGLSEGMFWDFKNGEVSKDVMEYFGFPESIISEIVPTFSVQSRVCKAVAEELGLREGTPISYRAGDQPNNALSLNVMKPGEIAATGGTSGVVYGVLGEVNYDKLSRVNTFAHVNHGADGNRLGVLLCINGTGILNAWMKRTVAPEGISYAEMNQLAESVPVGAEGLSVIPFGNGAERVLQNENPGASVHGLQFNIHTKAHMVRAAQEGIAFSFAYGMEVMAAMGMEIKTIKAGHANLFLSPLFRRTLAAVTGATIELYETDGSVGAAYGAGIGAGIYKDSDDAFKTLKLITTEAPLSDVEEYKAAYQLWKQRLGK
ncbi:MAG: FGGY family carbohydrate kinase, partial [Bacteroidales bacterium]|nr:FGGY family carbohydrate kinase [Bacteroidales bacterium]